MPQTRFLRPFVFRSCQEDSSLFTLDFFHVLSIDLEVLVEERRMAVGAPVSSVHPLPRFSTVQVEPRRGVRQSLEDSGKSSRYLA